MEYIVEFSQAVNKEERKIINSKIKRIWTNIKSLNLHSSITKIIFSIGGDGTFLSSVHKYGDNYLYIPINAGTLGFYSSWSKDDIEKIFLDNKSILELKVLEVEIDNKKYYAINETTIINPINTQILDVYVNEIYLEQFRGTGICVSTPMGSTAYNKSLGGALIPNNIDIFEFSKIAPINNLKHQTICNPIILTNKDTLTLMCKNQDLDDTRITIDRENFALSKVKEIKIRLSDKTVKVLISNDSYWKKVRSKFLKSE